MELTTTRLAECKGHWASEAGNVSEVRGILVNVYFSLD